MALLGLVLAGLGGVATAFGARMLSDADDSGGYPSLDGREAARLSPVALATVGVVLLVAGLYLLLAG